MTVAQLPLPDFVRRTARRDLTRHPELVAKARAELKGKVLGCWCAPKACHAKILAEIVNGEGA